MAFVDTLPLFVPKPLSIKPIKSRLVQRAVSETPEDQDQTKTTPTDQGLATGSIPGEAITSRFTPKNTTYLPEVYSAYQPLFEALDSSKVVNPQARAAVLAQMGLERGWKHPTDFNYGNITTGSSWSGSSNKRGDTDAVGNRITQNFRSYGSADEFVEDYLNLLKRQYPDSYSELTSQDFNIDRFAEGLVGGKFKYAEDPNYREKIKRNYNSVITRITKSNNQTT